MKYFFILFFVWLLLVNEINCRRQSRLFSFFSRDTSDKEANDSDSKEATETSTSETRNLPADNSNIGRASLSNLQSPFTIPLPFGLMPLLLEPALQFQMPMTHAYHSLPGAQMISPFIHLPYAFH